MLQGLLGGLREVRAPLAAGYTFGATVYILFHSAIVDLQRPAIGLTGTQDLLAIVGRAGQVISLSFLLYLVGTMLVAISNIVFQLRTRPIEVSDSRLRQLLRGWSVTRNSEQDTLDVRFRELSKQLETQLGASPEAVAAVFPDLDERTLSDSLVDAIYRQLMSEAKGESLDGRLLVSAERVYDEVTRIRAESEVRGAIVIPGGALAMAVLIDLERPLWQEAVMLLVWSAFLVFLVVASVRERSRARRFVMRAVADGLITTPTIDTVQRLVPVEDHSRGASYST